ERSDIERHATPPFRKTWKPPVRSRREGTRSIKGTAIRASAGKPGSKTRSRQRQARRRIETLARRLQAFEQSFAVLLQAIIDVIRRQALLNEPVGILEDEIHHVALDADVAELGTVAIRSTFRTDIVTDQFVQLDRAFADLAVWTTIGD